MRFISDAFLHHRLLQFHYWDKLVNVGLLWLQIELCVLFSLTMTKPNLFNVKCVFSGFWVVYCLMFDWRIERLMSCLRDWWHPYIDSTLVTRQRKCLKSGRAPGVHRPLLMPSMTVLDSLPCSSDHFITPCFGERLTAASLTDWFINHLDTVVACVFG